MDQVVGGLVLASQAPLLARRWQHRQVFLDRFGVLLKRLSVRVQNLLEIR